MGWVTPYHPTTTELNACVQCGLCLPHCPTFRITGLETHSPRGRLQAMVAVNRGDFEVDRAFEEVIAPCLGCRACEPVCPGLVPFGRVLEGARAEISAQRGGLSHALRARLLAMPPGLIRAATLALRLAYPVRRLLPVRLRRLVSGIRPPNAGVSGVLGMASGSGAAGRVALLTGCVQDSWFPQVNTATSDLLQRAGFRVEAPSGQVCCGALAAHDGKADTARSLAGRNVAALAGYDVVVATAAGCSAHLRHYRDWTDGGEAVGERAVDVTVLVASLVAEGRLPSLADSGVEIGVQDPCHLRHAQREMDAPRRVLLAGGMRPVEVDTTGMCCGAAGIYSILQPEHSETLGNLKAAAIRSTGVTRIASANPGCEMQLRAYLGSAHEILHPVEWYHRALLEAAG